VHARGDVYCSSDFGRRGLSHQVLILMDGDTSQSLNYSSGAIVPALTVDKTVSDRVMAIGDNPILIDGNFSVNDGTFHTNGHDIYVGNV